MIPFLLGLLTTPALVVLALWINSLWWGWHSRRPLKTR